MEMLVDAQLIRNERLKRAWSQEHLAQVTGLGLRTVQRIENGGNASLETIKALASVLEIPVEALLAEAPAQPEPIPPVRFSLFKPWRTFAAGCMATLIATGSILGMQGAFAEQVRLDFALKLEDASVSQTRMTSEDGTAAVMETSELKISIKPTIQDDGTVLLEAEIYVLRNGEYELVSEPRILTMNGQPAKYVVGDENENGDFTGVELLVTPTIE